MQTWFRSDWLCIDYHPAQTQDVTRITCHYSWSVMDEIRSSSSAVALTQGLFFKMGCDIRNSEGVLLVGLLYLMPQSESDGGKSCAPTGKSTMVCVVIQQSFTLSVVSSQFLLRWWSDGSVKNMLGPGSAVLGSIPSTSKNFVSFNTLVSFRLQH